MKETEWIDGKIKPVRVGVYKRQFLSGEVFAWWGSGGWGLGTSTPVEAARLKKELSCTQTAYWKGLDRDYWSLRKS